MQIPAVNSDSSVPPTTHFTGNRVYQALARDNTQNKFAQTTAKLSTCGQTRVSEASRIVLHKRSLLAEAV
jgi:hypothetical protein